MDDPDLLLSVVGGTLSYNNPHLIYDDIELIKGLITDRNPMIVTSIEPNSVILVAVEEK